MDMCKDMWKIYIKGSRLHTFIFVTSPSTQILIEFLNGIDNFQLLNSINLVLFDLQFYLVIAFSSLPVHDT